MKLKGTCRECKMCAELKPQFCKQAGETFVKATRPWERIAVDFKGPVKGKIPYVLVVIDEFSRFPFAFPLPWCFRENYYSNLNSVILCIWNARLRSQRPRICVYGIRIERTLRSRNVATSRTPPYQPEGNSQCERLNSTLWKTVNSCCTLETFRKSSGTKFFPTLCMQ